MTDLSDPNTKKNPNIPQSEAYIFPFTLCGVDTTLDLRSYWKGWSCEPLQFDFLSFRLVSCLTWDLRHKIICEKGKILLLARKEKAFWSCPPQFFFFHSECGGHYTKERSDKSREVRMKWKSSSLVVPVVSALPVLDDMVWDFFRYSLVPMDTYQAQLERWQVSPEGLPDKRWEYPQPAIVRERRGLFTYYFVCPQGAFKKAKGREGYVSPHPSLSPNWR